MQRLVWQNSNGDEINLTSGNYGITNWEGFANTPLNIQSQQVPFQDGGVFLDALMEQRELSVTLAMYDGGNLETRYRMRRELVHILNPKLGEGYLIYTNDFISKRIKCVAQIPLFETHNSNNSGTPKASLAWTACEPYWEDLEETEFSFDVTQQPIIRNEGDVSCQMEMDWYTNGVTNGKVTNITQGQSIEYEGELTESLRINTNYGEKSVLTENMKFSFENFGFGLMQIIWIEDLKAYFAVGAQGIFKSENGEDWDLSGASVDIELRGICYSEELKKIVAVGSQHYGVSADGENWLFGQMSEYNVYHIGYSKTAHKFVALAGVRTYLSENGTDWVAGYVSNVTLNAIESNENLTILIGDDGTILTSENCIDWTSQTSGTNAKLVSVVYSKKQSLFVIVVAGNSAGLNYLYGTDGVNWNAVNIIAYSGGGDICYADGLDIFVNTSSHSVRISSDGINWTGRSDDSINQHIAYSESLNKMITVGGASTNENVISKSYNGLDWEIVKTGIAGGYKKITYSKKLDLYVVTGTKTISSKDCQNWGDMVDIAGNSICYSEKLGLFVIVGNTGSIYTSENAIDWTPRTSGVNVDLEDVIYAESESIFVVVGKSGKIITSTDGINWTTYQVTSNPSLMSIVYSLELHKFVAIGEAIVVSEDGVNWVQKNNPSQYASYTDVIYVKSKKMFVAIGRILLSPIYVYVITSKDGNVWSGTNIIESETVPKAMDYSNSLGEFIFTFGRVIKTTPDFINFLTYSSYPSTLYDIKYFETLDKIVIVGESGVILTSYYTLGENRIDKLSADSNMNMSLVPGDNRFRINKTSGNMTVRIKYRQKYIGV